MMSKAIVVVGSLNLDLVANVPRLPEEGETLTGLSFATHPGGKGANQAVSAAKLGADVQMIGRLGDDVFAQTLRNSLHEVGVDSRGVRNIRGASGCAVILVSAAGQNSIVVVPGANASLTPADLDHELELVRGAGILLAQLEVPLKTVIHLGEIARQRKIPLMLDPAPAQNLPRWLLENVTWLTPNDSEARFLLKQTGHPLADEPISKNSALEAATALLAFGPKNIALKLGELGVFLTGQDVQCTFVPAHQVTVKDTTAAGDAFNGGFAHALMQGMSPADAAKFACAVAAVSVTRSGAQPSMPTASEVSRFLAERA